MNNFDNMVIGSAGAFTSAFQSTAEGTYHANGRPALENVTIMFDSQMFEPDPLGDGLVERSPQITIETASISCVVKKDDRFEFNDIKVKVEHNEGDELGLTTLRVRVI